MTDDSAEAVRRGQGTAPQVLSDLAFEMPCPVCHVRRRRLCRNEKREVLDWLHGERVTPIVKAFYMGIKHQVPAKQGET